MKIFYRILFGMIAICIPIVSIFSACNIVFRLPDLYVYEFNSNEISNEIDLSIPDDELGQFFSDFMIGKEADFDLFTEYRDREQAVFGADEQINMENARKLLNDTLYIIGSAALLIIVSYWILILKKKKYELRLAFKGGIAVFTAMQVLFYAAFYFENTRTFFYRLIFINPFGADDVLPLMLTGRFVSLSMLANSVVAMILMVIFASVTWRLTKPRRMFW